MERIKRRLVVCQGSIQLVSAVAAIMTRESENPQADNARDHLLIADLYAPAEQEDDFAGYLYTLAMALRQWTKVTRLSTADLREYEKRAADGDVSAVLSTFRKALDAECLDELYVSKEWQFSNRLPINAFHNSTKICYGDGFGLYYASGYFRFGRRGIDRITSWARKVWRGRRGTLKKVSCDMGYFIYPHAMGESPRMTYRRTSRVYATDLMRKAASLVPSDVVGDLARRTSKRDVFVLVTTNLTESGQTEEDDEIEAYRQLLLENGLTSTTVVLLKPHPRDSQAKIRRIAGALSQKCDEVIALTDDALFYAPLESLMMRLYECQWEEIHRKLKIFTFSSAAVTIAGVLGISPVIGFGETIIRQRFRHKSAEWRLNHEQDLRTAVHRVLEEQRQQELWKT